MGNTLINQDKTIHSKQKELYSFDIFDTLVTRTVAEPCGIFAIMQNTMNNDIQYSSIPYFVKNNFCDIRKETEIFCRHNSKENKDTYEISLCDIYNTIQNNNGLNDEQKNLIYNLELSVEIKNLVPIRKNINTIKNLISENKKVILVSDMYLSQKEIRFILSHSVPDIANLDIIVSSEFKKSKAEGTIYPLIKEREQIEYKNWHHFGDNNYSDIKQAKKYKINAHFLAQEGLMPYETEALSDISTSLYAQASVGISKLARTNCYEQNKIYNFGCSFAGVILYNYVNWVIEQAIYRHLDTIHFVARDGYVLKEIADIIINQKNLNIKTKYIYGSRKAWRIPDADSVDDYIKYICNEYTNKLNLKFLAERFSISEEEFKSYYKYNSLKNLSSKKRKELTNYLINNKKFKQRILEINTDKSKLLKEYLLQELDLSKEEILFVDVNGSGRTQDIVSNFIDKKIIGCYLHVELNAEQKENSQKITYISTQAYRHFGIELLCRNPDGQTLGYQKDIDGKIIPILEKINTKKIINWGYYSYLDGIKEYTKLACKFELNNNISLNSYEMYKKYFLYFTENLDTKTAEIIGSIPYVEVGDENNVSECAKKYNIIDVVKVIFSGKYEPLCFISLTRIHPKYRKILNFCNKYGSLSKFFFTIFIRQKTGEAYIRILGFTFSFRKLLIKIGLFK